AILEDDQLVEIYFQRANEYSLAGSIHKGRVTRVLPGMQSAFVDLGLERDTFLYVSDFFEENEEFERMPEGRGGDRGADRDRGGDRERGRGRDRDGGRGRGRDRERREALPIVQAASADSESVIEIEPASSPDSEVVLVERASAVDSADLRRGNRRRRRGRGNQGGNFPESKFAAAGEDEAVTEEIESVIEEQLDSTSPELPILLPGESLSKYSARQNDSVSSEDLDEEADESDDSPIKLPEAPAPEPAPLSQEASVTPLHALTPESIAERREAEVLAEVKAHLAEIAKEKEEERDFEEAERLVYEDQESSESGHNLPEAVQLDVFEDAVEIEPLSPEAADAEAGEADLLSAPGDEEYDPADSGGTLPSLGYSAHIRQDDQRFLQQRSSDSSERSGRRRRRGGRGRDRLSDPIALPREDAPESPIEPDTPVAAADPAPRRESRDDRRGRRDRGDRGDRGDRSHSDRPDRERRPLPSITELLREGQEILVQIAKEPLGQKGARITSHIALPGRYCVYMPTVDHTGVSRKIASDEERLRLKRILQSRKEGIPGGFIIRTAGEGRTEEEILADIDFLHNLWIDIRKKAESRPAPALVYHDLEIVERVLRDQLGPEFKSIWVDNEEIYERILRFLERFQPQMVSRVRMYTRQVSIFDNFGITQELEKALRPKVWLKSGGYIVINQTEALVAIDINTGKFVGKSNRLEDTIVKTNIEAIREIVRQIRLRDLGGIIVIDFIDMDERKNRMRVMQSLEEAMRADRAPYKILQFNDFGLVAITRKRVKQSLERTLCAPCPYCEGSGYVKSVSTVVGEILNEAKKLAPALEDSKDVLLRVNPEVAKLFKSSENQHLEELEELLGRPVMVVSDGLIHQEKFDLA
ncbi:MAG: Rne/Rng family ribonuclease, partial [Acidobacteriota bacterium]